MLISSDSVKLIHRGWQAGWLTHPQAIYSSHWILVRSLYVRRADAAGDGRTAFPIIGGRAWKMQLGATLTASILPAA